MRRTTAPLPMFFKEEEDTFKFEILLTVDTTAGKTFTIPINDAGAVYAHNFVVEWGDESSSTVTSYDDADRTHI